MIFVDIDVAKNKHDCYILDSSKDMIETKFSFLNSLEDISKVHLTKLTNILSKNSKGHYTEEKAKKIKFFAVNSIGRSEWTIGFELQQTIRLIQHT